MKTALRSFLRGLFALAAVTMAAGCVTSNSVPYPEFAQLEPVPRVDTVGEKCVLLTQSDLRKEARSQRILAKDVLAFWERTEKDYGPYLADSRTDAAMLDQQIAALVAKYAACSDKASVAAELSDTDWPNGLRNYQLGSGGESADRMAPPLLAGESAMAVKAWPVWVKRTLPPQGTFPADFSELNRSWTNSYESHRRELRRFWLAVALTVDRQRAHWEMHREAGTAKEDIPPPAERGGAPLPLNAGEDEQRLRVLRARFATMPIFQKDADSFRPASTGPEPCPMPRVEMFGRGIAWTAVIFSWASGQHWLATGRYGDPATEPQEMSLYRQKGYGWYVLPFLGWGEGSVLRYPLQGTAQAGPPEIVGSAVSLWPFWIFGQGEGLTVAGNNTSGYAYGMPLVYAWGDVQDRHGMHVQASEALHGLLYAGVTVTQPPRSSSVDAVGAGLFWLSTYDQKSDTSTNGVLWGAFGWGKLAGEPVYWIFGIPIHTRQAVSQSVPAEISVEQLPN
jgi:hypothetical protein